jgi:hypothetical protein
MSFGLLNSIIPQTNTNALLYQSISNRLVIGKVSISSKNYSPSKIRVGISTDNGVTVDYLYYNRILNYGETLETDTIYFGVDQKLIVRSSEPNVNFLLYGEDVPDVNLIKSGFLSSVNSTNNQKKTLFTSPSNYNSEVSISACNLDSIPGKARIGISTGSFDSADYLEYDVEIGTTQSYVRNNIKLGPNQSIVCSSSLNSNIDFACYGVLSYITGEDQEIVNGNLVVNGNINSTGNVNASGNVNVSGVITATSFYGNGSNLTNVDRVGISSNGAFIGIATVINIDDNLKARFNSGIATISTSDDIDVKSNFTVNQNKFSVSGSSGNTLIDGTLDVGSNATISGDVNVLNNKVRNVGTAISTTDATNKQYVDTRSIAISIALS